MQLEHTLSDGLRITLNLKRTAKKNIILRPHSPAALHINIPPHLGEIRLRHWLQHNEPLLRRVLSRSPAEAPPDTAPEYIWYRGETHRIGTHDGNTVIHRPPHFLLPEHDWPQQKMLLRRFLTDRAAEILLPRLQRHACEQGLLPAASALSRAKTFWGVCRPHTGIRLNWRLVGAPDFVADYVCIHELCHLLHADHSPRFWSEVRRRTPHTDAAKQWLKQNGGSLFVLD